MSVEQAAAAYGVRSCSGARANQPSARISTVSVPHGRRPWSAIGLTLLAALVGAAATGAVSLVPALQFAYRAPALQAVLETGNAFIALAVGYLVYGRFRLAGRAQDLLLAYALVVVAVANLVLTALPAVLLPASEGLSDWVPLVVRFAGTVLLATSALLPRSLVISRRHVARNALLLLSLVVVCGGLGYGLGQQLPPAVDPGLVLDPSSPLVAGHPVMLAAQALGAAAYAFAAVSFARQAARSSDELLRWVAPACALAALARVNYLLFPSLYSDFVYTGDLLRLGFYVLLLCGAAREVRSYWEAQAWAAVMEDRRRLARDLHDGLAQELTYIHSQAQLLAEDSVHAPQAERIGGAAARAVDEARRAIAALSETADEPFAVQLQGRLHDLGSRYDVRVQARLDPQVEPSPGQAETLMRIAAEALRNAARHGAATTVAVSLQAPPLRMDVVDDGIGFDPRTARQGGFGITSMRERAEAAGATLSITSSPGQGATVRTEWL